MTNHRQSALETYSICGERYRRQYVVGEPSNNSAATLMGTAVHAAQEQVATEMRDNGNVVLPSVAETLAMAKFSMLVQEDSQGPDPIPWSSEEVIEARAEEAGALAAALAAESPEIWAEYGGPRLIEQRFEGAEFGGHVFEGTIDCATDEGILLDWKTARRDWPRNKKDKKLQPLVYAVGYHHLTGQWPKGFVFVVVTRTKQVQVRYHPVKVNNGKLLFLSEQVKEIERAIEAEVFPYNPSHELCSPDWCPFWDTCPASVLKAA